MKQRHGISRHGIGVLIAALLAGAWRTPAPPLSQQATRRGEDRSADALAELLPQLPVSEIGPLVWRRLAGSGLETSPLLATLRRSIRASALSAAVLEHQLRAALIALHRAGVEPLLIKGWSVARLYPQTALRLYEDIDLFLRPEQIAAARAALAVPAGTTAHPVDIHNMRTQFTDLAGQDPEEVCRRSQVALLEGVEVRMLGAEDQLRLSCAHFLRHGAWRPLWLVDIGVMLEALPHTFDWEYCLSGDPVRAGWVLTTAALAGQLLGADTARTPFPQPAASYAPGWLGQAVLRQWSTRERSKTAGPLAAMLRHPHRIPAEIGVRWPNPIYATASCGARFDEQPRLPLQIADFTRRGVTSLRNRFAERLHSHGDASGASSWDVSPG